MNKGNEFRIVPGLSTSTTAKATVDESIADVLFVLRLNLKRRRHYRSKCSTFLAALVLSARATERMRLRILHRPRLCRWN